MQRLTHTCLSKVLVNCDASVIVDLILGPVLNRSADSGTFTVEVPATRAEAFHNAFSTYFDHVNRHVDIRVEPSLTSSEDECLIYSKTGILDFNFSTIADRLLDTVSNNFSRKADQG